MLAKQLWRLMDSPDTLFTKVFKSRYFRNSDPLEPTRSYSPSYGWRSIISARSLVRKGLIKRVGTGSSISVWNDAWIPAPRPRSATCKFSIYPSDLKVKDLIDNQTNTWNMPLLEAVIIPEDVDFIQSLAISRFGRSDTIGWHFTKNGKYTVKSGYWAETQYPDKESGEVVYGPTTTVLQAFVWTLRCPPKIQHFIWQMITGCVSVMKNLRSRGIQCDTQCGFCGEEEETINHVIFECPQAVQTWALSKVPSHPDIFPMSSVFTNLEYLFYRQPIDGEEGFFPWIIWYIWKSRNDKLYKGKDRNPQDILILAEAEGKLWEDSQKIEDKSVKSIHVRLEPIQQGVWWCQVDGSWKNTDKFSGQGWVCTKGEMDELMLGARNIRRSQSPLYAELEALLWAMECMQCLQRTNVAFTTDCSDVVKMVSSPEEWPAFAVHLDEFKRRKSMLEDVRIAHRPRATNIKADNLARSAREHPLEVVYVHAVPPTWLLKPF